MRRGLGCGCTYIGTGLINLIAFFIFAVSLIMSGVTDSETTTEGTSALTIISGIFIILVLLADAVLLLVAGWPMARDGLQERGLLVKRGKEDEEDEESEESDEGDEDGSDEAEEAEESEESEES